MKQVVFTTGRMNPPTKGHEKLLRQARNLAKTTGSDCRFYVTRTHDGKKNPLPVEQKLAFLREFFPGSEFYDCVNAFYACREMADAGYERVVLVVGEDRDGELVTGLRKYINNEDPAKSLGLKEIDTYVVARDPNDFSATKARQMAVDGNLDGFTNMVPSAQPQVVKALYDAVRQGLGVKDARIR